MKYSLRSLMIVVMLGPPLLAFVAVLFRDYRETTIAVTGLGIIAFAFCFWMYLEGVFKTGRGVVDGP